MLLDTKHSAQRAHTSITKAPHNGLLSGSACLWSRSVLAAAVFFSPTVTATLFAIAATFHAPDSPRAHSTKQPATRAPAIQQPTRSHVNSAGRLISLFKFYADPHPVITREKHNCSSFLQTTSSSETINDLIIACDFCWYNFAYISVFMRISCFFWKPRGKYSNNVPALFYLARKLCW
jgi:hypothetical protein